MRGVWRQREDSVLQRDLRFAEEKNIYVYKYMQMAYRAIYSDGFLMK